MEKQEYLAKLEKLAKEYTEKENSLHLKYGLSQSRFQIGDIIKDVRTEVVIKIDKIAVSMGFNRIPYPRYMGLEVKKDFTPKKNNSRGAIYGNENVELIKSK